MNQFYVSNDNSCQLDASQLAEERGIALAVQTYFAPLPVGDCERMLYDLDNVAPEQRQALIGRLGRDALTYPTAVHSYNLADEEASAMQQNGVRVFRRLDEELLDAFFTVTPIFVI